MCCLLGGVVFNQGGGYFLDLREELFCCEVEDCGCCSLALVPLLVFVVVVVSSDLAAFG